MKWLILLAMVLAAYFFISKYYVSPTCLSGCKANYDTEISACRSNWREASGRESIDNCIMIAKEKKNTCYASCGKK